MTAYDPKLAARVLKSCRQNGDYTPELIFIACELAVTEKRVVTTAEVRKLAAAQGVKFDHAGWIVE